MKEEFNWREIMELAELVRRTPIERGPDLSAPDRSVFKRLMLRYVTFGLIKG